MVDKASRSEQCQPGMQAITEPTHALQKEYVAGVVLCERPIDTPSTRAPEGKTASAESSSSSSGNIPKSRSCEERQPWEILDPSKKRYFHLDLVRVMCVFLVAIDHAWWMYSQENNMWSQSWVLQMLWVVAGIAFTLNPKPLWKTVPYLFLIFVVGVSLNWMAWAINGQDWKGQFGNVIFQFWFVAGLLLFTLITAPLKPILLYGFKSLGRLRSHRLEKQLEAEAAQEAGIHLYARMENGQAPVEEFESQQGREGSTTTAKNSGFSFCGFNETADGPFSQSDRDSICRFAAVFGTFFLIQVALGIWLSQEDTIDLTGPFAKIGLDLWASGFDVGTLVGQLMFVLGMLTIVICGGRMLKSPRTSPWLSWVFVVYVLVTRSFIIPGLYGQTALARSTAGLGLFLTGMLTASRGMAGAVLLRTYVIRYWFFLALILTLLWQPNWSVRFDEHPPSDIVTALRVVASEMMCVIIFLTAGEHMFDDRIFTEDHAQWLGDFGLILFVVHMFLHIVLGHERIPWNWVVIIFLAFLCWYRRRRSVKAERSPEPPFAATPAEQLDIREAEVDEFGHKACPRQRISPQSCTTMIL